MTRLLAYLPRGNTLDDRAWHKRHMFLQALLLLHLLALFVFGLFMGRSVWDTMVVLSVPAACLVLGHLIRHRRVASVLITAGLTYGSAVLVSFSGGSIEAHFHFFIMIGFIALYQDWVPFLWNVVFTVLSHGLGSVARTDLIFNHPAGQTSPWVWSTIHGVAVLAACCGVIIFWETTEREQRKTLSLTKQLADAEITRRRFTSDLLVNLARRNQSLLYRQLGLINQLEDQEEDPDALADLFRLDHLATRIRRNAESLLVLSGEEPPRTWGRPVALVDVVRAAIAETEDLDRVVFAVDERLAVLGNAVADLTHLVAELVENAVHFSPPQASVIIRTRPYLQEPGAQVLTVEDWGVGMRADDMEAANDLLATPQDVDLSVSQRLGLHVVARLAQRHGIEVSLTPTPGGGVTAAVLLPSSLFSEPRTGPDELVGDDTEVPAGVLPAAVAASMVAPAADFPSPVPVPPPPPAPVRASAPAPAPPSPPIPEPAERWIDLTDDSAGNGHGHGDGNGAERHAGVAADWSGWWEPAPGDLDHAEPLSPIAARPPLSERVQSEPVQSARIQPDRMQSDPVQSRRVQPERPHSPTPGTPEPHPQATPRPHPQDAARPYPQATPRPHPQGTPEPHQPGGWAPEREGSRQPEGAPAAVHSPRTDDPLHPAPPHPASVAAASPSAPGPEGEGLVLSRRMPQAHLAPELRRDGPAVDGGAPDGRLPDASEARAALSRYQASRQAAKAVVEETGAEPPTSAGGWT